MVAGRQERRHGGRWFFLLLGFSSDICRVAERLSFGDGIILMDEKTPDDFHVPYHATVIFMFGLDTGYSSQLLSRYSLVHYQYEPEREYVLGMDDVALDDQVFDFLRDVTRIDMKEFEDLHEGFFGKPPQR